MATWLAAFGLTLAVELPVYRTVAGRAFGSTDRLLFAALLLNLATHPTLWLLWRPAGLAEVNLILVEGIVFLTEALLLLLLWRSWASTAVRWRPVLLAAFLANAASTLVGLSLYAVAG